MANTGERLGKRTLAANLGRPPTRSGKKASRSKSGKLKAAKSAATKPKPAPASSSARLRQQLKIIRRQLQASATETREARERQTATADILKVIASSPSDEQPVFDAIAMSSRKLTGGFSTAVFRFVGGLAHLAAFTPTTAKADEVLKAAFPLPVAEFEPFKLAQGGQPMQIKDTENHPNPRTKDIARARGYRSMLLTPLMSNGQAIGLITITRVEPGSFADQHVQLLQTFADQAVIAIENVRLFNETKEALERQTATAEVLQVVSNSISSATPVFERILESTERLIPCDNANIFLVMPDEHLHLAAFRGPGVDGVRRLYPRPLAQTTAPVVIAARQQVVYEDAANHPDVSESLREAARASPRGTFSVALTPLIWEGKAIGMLNVSRDPDIKFNDRELSLLRTFADQAVIAIQNTRLFNETKEALERQTATSDILKVIASSPSNVQPVFEAIAERSNRLIGGLSAAVYSIVDDAMHLMAFTRIGPEADAALQASFPRPLSDASWADRIRRGKVVVIADAQVEFATNPALLAMVKLRGYRSQLLVPLLHDGTTIGVISVTRLDAGAFAPHHLDLLQTFADQAVIAIGNVRLFDEVQARTRELSKSLDDLRTAQDRLVQTEKLASLGQLTAGIAHEIKNPLNFVNNFAALSAELTDELDETLAPAPLEQKMRDDIGELTAMLKSNLEKVVQHGKRADSIVKNMLQHSREGSGERRASDLNALVSESLNLAYHGARAERRDFNIALKQDLDPAVGAAEVYPQELMRALLNLISNGFYAAIKRKIEADGESFEPMLTAATKVTGDVIEIRIRDNGTGIPAEIREKIFNPFFTTKPTGEGTGLGLSMAHDIIVKQHGWQIDVETEPGAFTEFIITMPRGNGTASERERQ